MSGGTDDAGTVFELTPSGGSWTKTTLYSFTGGSDGASPGQLLVGHDGNLYGTASDGGVNRNGVVFQLTFSGGQWTQSVLHAFNGADGIEPRYLVQDGTGNLYGIVSGEGEDSPYGAIFVLENTGSGWAFSENTVVHSCMPEEHPYDYQNNLVIDAAGNLYGTGTGGEETLGSSGKASPGLPGCSYNYVFKARYDSNGWHYQDLDFLLDTIFPAAGSLAVDSSGNLYGTTSGCGTNGVGTVWQVSP